MAAYRRFYDSRHLQADCQEPGIIFGALRSVIEYGPPLPFFPSQAAIGTDGRANVGLLVYFSFVETKRFWTADRFNEC